MDPMGYGCAAFGIQPIYGMRTVQQMFFGLRPYAEWIIPGSSTYSQVVCIMYCVFLLYIYIHAHRHSVYCICAHLFYTLMYTYSIDIA